MGWDLLQTDPSTVAVHACSVIKQESPEVRRRSTDRYKIHASFASQLIALRCKYKDD